MKPSPGKQLIFIYLTLGNIHGHAQLVLRLVIFPMIWKHLHARTSTAGLYTTRCDCECVVVKLNGSFGVVEVKGYWFLQAMLHNRSNSVLVTKSSVSWHCMEESHVHKFTHTNSKTCELRGYRFLHTQPWNRVVPNHTIEGSVWLFSLEESGDLDPIRWLLCWLNCVVVVKQWIE